MTVVVIAVLGVLVIGFAWTSGEWKRRSDFWEQAYMETAGNLEALLTGVEDYFDETEGLVRVFPAERRREVFH